MLGKDGRLYQRETFVRKGFDRIVSVQTDGSSEKKVGSWQKFDPGINSGSCPPFLEGIVM